MSTILNLILFFAGLTYGVICIYKPAWIAFIIAKFVKFGLSDSLLHSNQKLQEIILLIESEDHKYVDAYPEHITRIKLTGITAILVCSVGICMLIYN